MDTKTENPEIVSAKAERPISKVTKTRNTEKLNAPAQKGRGKSDIFKGVPKLQP